jgi:hypothetical protein
MNTVRRVADLDVQLSCLSQQPGRLVVIAPMERQNALLGNRAGIVQAQPIAGRLAGRRRQGQRLPVSGGLRGIVRQPAGSRDVQ